MELLLLLMRTITGVKIQSKWFGMKLCKKKLNMIQVDVVIFLSHLTVIGITLKYLMVENVYTVLIT